MGESYKAQIIRDLPASDTITVYHQGKWKDLCRGPHLPSTKHVGKAFKLTKLAGAYWRGDQNNAQLQRIYGTAWASEADLAAYLLRIEEAEKRDHRKLGKTHGPLPHAGRGPGHGLLAPQGLEAVATLEAYMRRRLDRAGYIEVKTPQVLDAHFWEKSGHWDKYRANMFVCETVEGEILSLKPMNCPGHVQIWNVGQRSYRELPMRMAEFGPATAMSRRAPCTA
jgi:threonyl-tRNA synthetase